MTHRMKLNPQPFEKIRTGEKTIEIRLNDDKRKKLNAGDIIEFTNVSTFETLTVEIKKLHHFTTFKELYEKFSPSVCGLSLNSVEERLAATYESYYTREQEGQFGVLGIEIKLINR